MELKLKEAELMRAVQVYMGSKMNLPSKSLVVKIHWRGAYATVTTPPIPTLNHEAKAHD